MKINEEKSKVIVLDKEHRSVNILINGVRIEQVKQVQVPGSDTRRQDCDLNETINKTFR